ncbi:MAG: GNAT family N-acetyltransferase [Pyrinomonadaceae bacterium]
MILETFRLRLREIEAERDAGFINELLNTPKFLKYIGDRGVRSDADSAIFIEEHYRQSYRDHGYGLYVVELISTGRPVGVCGFVRRETLPAPDLGFAFLPEFEGLGYGTESARAVLDHGQAKLGFTKVLAITSLDNHASGRLLEKLGFKYDTDIISPDGEKLRLFEHNYRPRR